MNWLGSLPYRFGRIPERRRSSRARFDAEIEITTKAGAVLKGIAIDVSRHGIAAIVHDELPVGDAVSLRFEDPDKGAKVVVREAIMRARSDHHCGFEFMQSKASAA